MGIPIKYKRFEFHPPKMINPNTYNKIKSKSKEEYFSELKILARQEYLDYYKSNKFLILSYKIITPLALLFMVAIFFISYEHQLHRYFMFLYIIILLFFIVIGLSGIIFEHPSFKRYLSKKKYYYKELKKKIDESDNYENFIKQNY